MNDKEDRDKIFIKLCTDGCIELANRYYQDMYGSETLCDALYLSIYGACINGHLDVIEWLIEAFNIYYKNNFIIKDNNHKILIDSCKNQQFNIVKYLCKNIYMDSHLNPIKDNNYIDAFCNPVDDYNAILQVVEYCKLNNYHEMYDWLNKFSIYIL